MDLIMSSLSSLMNKDLFSIISAICTLLMAVATWRMAVATKRMAIATQDTLDSLSKPNVIVYAAQRIDAPIMIQLVIENNGTSPAYDINFKIPDYFPTATLVDNRKDGQIPNMSKEELLRSGLKYLSPGARRNLNWGIYNDLKGSIGEAQLLIETSFGRKVNDSKTHSTLSIITLSDFYYVAANDNPDVRQAKALEKLTTKVTELERKHTNYMGQLVDNLIKIAVRCESLERRKEYFTAVAAVKEKEYAIVSKEEYSESTNKNIEDNTPSLIKKIVKRLDMVFRAK